MITYGTHCYSYYNITILFWLEWKRTQQTLKKQTNKKKGFGWCACFERSEGSHLGVLLTLAWVSAAPSVRLITWVTKRAENEIQAWAQVWPFNSRRGHEDHEKDPQNIKRTCEEGRAIVLPLNQSAVFLFHRKLSLLKCLALKPLSNQDNQNTE